MTFDAFQLAALALVVRIDAAVLLTAITLYVVVMLYILALQRLDRAVRSTSERALEPAPASPAAWLGLPRVSAWDGHVCPPSLDLAAAPVTPDAVGFASVPPPPGFEAAFLDNVRELGASARLYHANAELSRALGAVAQGKKS